MAKQRKKPGRKTIMGKTQRTAIIATVAAGGSIADAAGISGVSVRTIRRHMREDRQFGIGVLKARKKGKMRLVRKVTGSKAWQAAAWYLERTYGEEYGRKDRREVTGKGGGPIVNEHRGTIDLRNLTDDELRDLERIATNATRRAGRPIPSSN